MPGEPELFCARPRTKVLIDLPKFATIAASRISLETPGIRMHLATLHQFRTSPPSAEVQSRAWRRFQSLPPSFRLPRRGSRLRSLFPHIRSLPRPALRSLPSHGLCPFRSCCPLRLDSAFLSPALSQRSQRRVSAHTFVHLTCSLWTTFIPFPFRPPALISHSRICLL